MNELTLSTPQFQNQNENNLSDAVSREHTPATGTFFTTFCQTSIGGDGHAVSALGSTGPLEMENGSSAEMAAAPGNAQVEKPIAGSGSRGLQELSRASSQTEEQLNQFLTSIGSLLSPTAMGHRVQRAEQVPARSTQPAVSRFRVGSITNMPAPIADVERSKRAPIDFGSEELRMALLAGGERAQHVKCPKCKSDNVRRSSPACFYESYLRFFFMSPYRCRKCLSRFYRIKRRLSEAAVPQAAKRSRASAGELTRRPLSCFE